MDGINWEDVDERIRALKSSKSGVHTSDNRDYLVNVMKEEYGITDNDITFLNNDQLRQKIRGGKLDNLLDNE
jgi:hypothetical protein